MPIVDCESASIYYESHGPEAAPALVLAHGAGGNSMIWWQQVPHFARRFRVISFDHRGFARSPCQPDDFHPKHFADDLAAVLDHAGIERAALVCQSMGGWTGLRMGLTRPERVACLALCGTPGGLFLPEVIEALAAVGSRAGDEGIRGNAALAPDYPAREPEMAFLYDQINARNDRLDLASALPRMVDPEVRVQPEALAGWRIPTLIIAGEHDQLFPPVVLRKVAEHIPGAKLEEFQGCGHSPYFEQPDRFNPLIESFISQHLP